VQERHLPDDESSPIVSAKNCFVEVKSVEQPYKVTA